MYPMTNQIAISQEIFCTLSKCCISDEEKEKPKESAYAARQRLREVAEDAKKVIIGRTSIFTFCCCPVKHCCSSDDQREYV